MSEETKPVQLHLLPEDSRKKAINTTFAELFPEGGDNPLLRQLAALAQDYVIVITTGKEKP